MRRRRVGASGPLVSELAFGTWRTFGSSTSDANARASILKAYERGVTLFDTANIYQRGAVESHLGATLAGLPRDSYLVCTKAGYPTGDGPGGLSRRHLLEQCEGSLRRLGTGHIDLYVCHRPDPATPLEETLTALDELVRSGKVRYAGVSSFAPEALEHARALEDRLGLAPLVCNQPEYSLLVREPEAGVLPTAARLGLGTIAWAPLAQGVLSGKYRPGSTPLAGSRGAGGARAFMGHLLRERQLETVQRLLPLADAAGLTLPRLALAWVLRRPELSAAVVGASRPEQLDELLAASGTELEPDLLAAIDAILPRPF